MTFLRGTAVSAALLGCVLTGTSAAAVADGSNADRVGAKSCALTDLGTPLASITVHEGGYGPGPDGRLRGYALVSGENAALNVVDAVTGDRIDAVPLPGASGGWAITVDDQGTVYLGSYSNGSLYSYDPATGSVTDHGRPIESDSYVFGLSHGPDGTIYGGTYPGAHAFAFDPDTGQYTDFGSFDVNGSLYARATAFDPDTNTLFVGLGTTGARLFAIDVTTGTNREIPLPPEPTGTGFTDLRYHDGKLFGYLASQLIVLDARTGALLPLTDGTTGQQVESTRLISRGVSDPMNGVVYYSDFPPGGTTHRLMALDLATLTFAPAARNDTAGPLSGAALGFGFTDGPNGPVLHAFTGNYQGQAIQYDITTGVLTKLGYALLPTEPNLGHVVTDAAGSNGGTGGNQVYVNAFLNGNTAQYDPSSGAAKNLPRFGQVEGWIWHRGLMYSGIYPYGAVQTWDPANPTAAPNRLFSLEESHHQNRPMALVADDERLYVGTTPGYGRYGGALTIYDFATKTFEVHRHIVPDQTVSALLKVDGVVVGGSSIDGGTGTGGPIATEAKLFTADPVTGERLAEYNPVPGAHSINALTRTADGAVWGLADGTVFRFDVAAGKVVQRIRIYEQGLASGATDGELIAHPNGDLYVSSRNQLFVADPVSGRSARLYDGARRLALHPDGTFYTLTRTPGGGTEDTNRVARFDPSTARCSF